MLFEGDKKVYSDAGGFEAIAQPNPDDVGFGILGNSERCNDEQRNSS